MARRKADAAEATDVLPVHHMVRSLAAQDLPSGARGPATLDGEIQTYLRQGFNLHSLVVLPAMLREAADYEGQFLARLEYLFVKPEGALGNEAAEVHHMVRALAPANLEEGARGPQMLNEEVSEWLDKGFRIAFFKSLGVGDVNGVFTARNLYVFIKE